MDKIKKHLERKGYKVEERFDSAYKMPCFGLTYECETTYGNTGWINIYTDGSCLIIENVYPSCRHSILCSYGHKFVSTNGYELGHDEVADGKIIEIIEKTLSSYKIKQAV